MSQQWLSSVRAAAAALQQRQISSVELTELFLERIAQLNPVIGAFTDVLGESARREAHAIDKKRRTGAQLGVLAGVPIAIKDIIDTTPAVCCAGLPFLANYRPTTDAVVVRRLRRAGAVILGVTATDPGAFGVRTPAVRHPQHPELTVGGSSGGSGAAVAASLCLASLGSDTGGSIRIPAACCAIAGLKPTRGRVSLEGVRPLVWSLDHVGPLTRYVADLGAVQSILDPQFRRNGQSHQKLVVAHDPAFYQDAEKIVRDGFSQTLAACRDLGAELREVQLPKPDEVSEIHEVIFAAESTAYHMRLFHEFRDQYPALAHKIFDFAEQHRSFEYVLATRKRTELTNRVLSLYREVDLIVLPTLPVLTPHKTVDTIRLGSREVEYTMALVRYTCLFDHTGQPVVSMPSAIAGNGIPSSIQLVGNLRADAEIIEFAIKLEQALGLKLSFEVNDTQRC